MSVEGKEFFPLTRLVPQNHQWPIILRGCIIGEDVNDTVQRRAQDRSRLDKKINSQMDHSALLYWIFHAAKRRGPVKRPRFVVPTNSHAHGLQFHLAKY